MSDARITAVPASATLSTTLVARLRNAIMRGELLPGSKLNLDRLRTAFGVSLSPLREALCRLENDGLVALIDQRGYRVTPVSASNLTELSGFASNSKAWRSRRQSNTATSLGKAVSLRHCIN